MPLSAELTNKINSKYTPNTRGFFGPATIKQTSPTPTKYIGPKQNPIQSAVAKASAVGGQTVNMASSISSKIGQFAVNRTKDALNSGKLAVNTLADIQKQRYTNAIVSRANQVIDAKEKSVVEAYKSGKMSKADYIQAQLDLSKAYQESSKMSRTVSSGPTPVERGIAVADTASNIISLGSLSIGKAVAKGGVKELTNTGVKTVAQDLIKANSSKLEQVMMKVPAMKSLVQRNTESLLKLEAQKLVGESADQFITRNIKQATVGLFIKQPLVYQMNVGGAQDIYNEMMKGNYESAVKQSAWMATQMISGGPLGGVLKLGSKFTGKVGQLAHGTGSFIDEMSKNIGDKKGSQIADYLGSLKTTNPKEFTKAERVFRVIQETNLHMADGDAKMAAERALQHWSDAGIDLATVTPKKTVELLTNWVDAHQLKNNLIRTNKLRGIDPKDVDNYQVVRWDVDAKNALASQVERGGTTPQEALDVVNTWKMVPGNNAGQNYLLIQKLESLIVDASKNGKTTKEIAEGIRDISAVSVMPKGIQDKYKKMFAKLGFAIAQPFKDGTGKKVTPSVDYKDTRKLITAVQTADKEVFDIGTPPQAQLQYLSNVLSQSGLSPEATKEVAYRKLSEAVVSKLNELDVAKNLGFKTGIGDDTISGGKVIITKLAQWLDNKKPNKVLNLAVANRAPGPATTDLRQMTKADISEALGITRDQAGKVSSAIIDGYTKVPLEYRGLGDAVVDQLYKINPLHKYYSRIQSAFRYTYNPFFRIQERTETKMLTHAQAGNLIWNKSKEELNIGAKLLDESGIFRTGLSGEAAQDLVLGRVTANITQAQKRDLAGLAMSMAKSKGMTLDEMLLNSKDEVADALRVIVQYPNKGVLNSSLARTMNIAFFPIRYNLKVTKLAAEILSKEPPTVQLAVLNSLFNMKDWLKSDEGIKWQSQHTDALQVLQWLTPVNSIAYGMKVLTGSVDSIGDLGSLGGLPLGVITQILDSEGLINLNTPYVNPKTGDVMPKYIPQTTKAMAATAIQDLIGSMFTYPGRILGLPGKQQSINGAVQQFTDVNGRDFDKRLQTDRLTPLQQQWVKVLKGDTSPEAVDKLYNSPAQDKFNWYTIPPLDLPVKPLVTPQPKMEQRTGLPSKASTKKSKQKKIAQPIPQR